MLFKQSGKIEIIIRKADYDANTAGANEQGTNETPNGENKKEVKNKSRNALGLTRQQTKLHLVHAVQTARHLGLTAINLAMNDKARQTGDSALQAKAERQIELAKDVANPLVNAGTAFTAGTIGTGGNIMAGAISAVLSLVNTTTTTWAKYEERRRAYNYKVAKENNAIEYKRARANVNLVTGRLR